MMRKLTYNVSSVENHTFRKMYLCKLYRGPTIKLDPFIRMNLRPTELLMSTLGFEGMVSSTMFIQTPTTHLTLPSSKYLLVNNINMGLGCLTLQFPILPSLQEVKLIYKY